MRNANDPLSTWIGILVVPLGAIAKIARYRIRPYIIEAVDDSGRQ
jgi:hypothetical protein